MKFYNSSKGAVDDEKIKNWKACVQCSEIIGIVWPLHITSITAQTEPVI